MHPSSCLHGIDTVQCAYYLSPPLPRYLDFAKLAVIKEQLRMDKSREPRAVTLGGTEFFLHPYGSSSGYPFVLTNEDFKIEAGRVQHSLVLCDLSEPSPLAGISFRPP